MCSVCINLIIVISIITIVFISYPHFAYWREQITGLIAGLTSEVWSAKEVGPSISHFSVTKLFHRLFLAKWIYICFLFVYIKVYQIKNCSQKSSTAKNESQTHKNIVTQRCPCDWALSRFWKINWSCDIGVHLWLNYYYYYICKTILWNCSQLVCRLMESKLNTYVSLCSLFSRARESDSSLKNEPVAVGRYTVRVWKQKPDEFRCICSNLNRFDFYAEIRIIFFHN